MCKINEVKCMKFSFLTTLFLIKCIYHNDIAPKV